MTLWVTLVIALVIDSSHGVNVESGYGHSSGSGRTSVISDYGHQSSGYRSSSPSCTTEYDEVWEEKCETVFDDQCTVDYQ